MKSIKFFLLFIALVFALSIYGGASMEDANGPVFPEATAGSMILADAETGKILYSKNGDEKLEPASITKIMTVLLAVEAIERGDIRLGDMVTAGESAYFDVIEDSSTSEIQPGETLTLEDLLYCAMLPSAGEACNIIAEHVAGDAASFVKLMNQRAHELGCLDTVYENTHGLPHANQRTTASDQLKVMREAVSHQLFVSVSSSARHTVAATNMSGQRDLKNTNLLVDESSDFYYPHCLSGKTGYTSAAGYCLVSEAEKGDMRLISVVMKAAAEDNLDGTKTLLTFPETRDLFEWGFDNFEMVTLFSPNEPIAQTDLEQGRDADHILLSPQSQITALLPKGTVLDDFILDIQVYNESEGRPLKAPVEAGEELGEVTMYLDGENYGTVKLVAANNVELDALKSIKAELKNVVTSKYFILGCLLLLALIIIYIVYAVRYNRRRRLALLKRQEKIDALGAGAYAKKRQSEEGHTYTKK
jgi:D-alanyl-D-alanine carboxypeptidase (penicillin-binding protein 5/6)